MKNVYSSRNSNFLTSYNYTNHNIGIKNNFNKQFTGKNLYSLFDYEVSDDLTSNMFNQFTFEDDVYNRFYK